MVRVCEKCGHVVDLPKRRLCSKCAVGKVNEYKSPWERVVSAAVEVAHADSDAEYARAEDNLRKSARAWAMRVK